MSGYISFRPTDVTLGALHLSVTRSVFEKLSGGDLWQGKRLLTTLSASRTLLMTNAKENEKYYIHTPMGNFFCGPSQEGDTLCLIGFHPNNLEKQTQAMKNGVGFHVSDLVVQVRLYRTHGLSCDLVNGSEYPSESTAPSPRSVLTVRQVMLKARQLQAQRGQRKEDSEPEYVPARGLSNLLTLAENYAVLSSELEKKTVHTIGNVPYHDLGSAPEFRRLDRIAYAFRVKDLDEGHIKPGLQIDIEDLQERRHSAEILSIKKDGDESRLTVLFSDQVDLSQLRKSGFFTLTFSTVNRDVQLAANEKIRAGEAPAKYMDRILGYHQPSGFTAKDLSGLKAALSQGTRPPNASQLEAITKGIQANDVFLVMGPPGTGKTTVILEWVKYFVQVEKKRVLVSSQNNKAVDNVLARFGKERDINMIRIGSESKVQSEVIPFLFENKIKNIRQEISAATQHNLELLGQLSTAWSRYREQLLGLLQLTEGVTSRKQRFDERMRQELRPLYDRLCQLAAENDRLHGQEQAARAGILERYQVIQNGRSASGLRRLFARIAEPDRSRKLKRQVTDYDVLLQRQAQLAGTYDQTMEQFQRLREQLRRELFLPYFDALCAWRPAFSAALSDAPRISNPWSLFSGVAVTQQNLAAAARLDPLIEGIRTELDRAQQLSNAIDDWRKTVTEEQNYALNELVLDSVNLVGATCVGINSQKRFSDLTFDVTIIDEAGQIQIHNALVPMSVSNKLIMLGDHKQIPPSADPELLDACVQNDLSTEYLEKSLFEKLYETLPTSNKIMLDTQYRMPAEIADTISEWFYQGLYFSPKFKQGLTGLLPRLSSRPFVVIDTSKERNRYETKVPDAGSNNALEATIVYRIIADCLRFQEDLRLQEVGVISAYKSQVKLISSKLEKLLEKNQVEDMVATLDSFQGQERDLILYSFTKSSTIPADRKRIGFLNELRRLNVAMTRCKKTLVLIGDMDFLSSCRHMEEDSQGQPDYEKSEKQFSDFIRTMLAGVVSGRGELLSYREFDARMKREQ